MIRILGALLLLLLSSVNLGYAQSPSLEKILEERSAAMVTVRFMMHAKMDGTIAALMGDKQDLELEATCIAIDPKGLILCSNTQLSGSTDVMARLIGQMGGAGDVVTVPTQISVFVADSTKGYEAKLLARDADLDLAWLQVTQTTETPFTHFDLASSGAAKIGEEVVAIRRLDRFFDRSPALVYGRVSAIVRKPRLLYLPTGGIEANLGSPVLNQAGQLIGIVALQLPDRSARPSSGGMLEVMGWSSRMQDVAKGMVIPAAEILKATQGVVPQR
jgi:S1-C subfamily serine protease